MIVLGLTGSIGMGKSTAAGMFRDLGAPVFDSDRCVHELYDGAAVQSLERLFPGVSNGGRIDRNALGALVLNNPEALARLEGVIHPLVREQRAEFLRKMRSTGARIGVVDVPLLFETGAQSEVDAIVVVTADVSIQRQRVLARSGMSEAKFAAILSRQVSDAEKRRGAHFIIHSDSGFESAKRQILTIVAAVGICERRDPRSQLDGE